jgi:hypothetical protein
MYFKKNGVDTPYCCIPPERKLYKQHSVFPFVHNYKTYIHSIALDRALASLTGFVTGIYDVGLSAPWSTWF